MFFHKYLVPLVCSNDLARTSHTFAVFSKLILLELTSPHNSRHSIKAAHTRKESKVDYCCLLRHLEKICLKPDLVALEIGSLGHWGLNSATSIAAEVRSVLDSAAETAIAGSHQLFFCKT